MPLYPLKPGGKAVQLTWDATTSTARGGETSGYLLVQDIARISPHPSGSQLVVVNPNGSTNDDLFCTEAPADVAALTGTHILLTPTPSTSGSPFYLSVNSIACGPVEATTHRVVSYINQGAVIQVYVSETLAALTAAINAAASPEQYTATYAADGVDSGTATPMTFPAGEDVTAIVTGANSVKGVRFEAPAGSTGSVRVVNNAVGYLLVYPISTDQWPGPYGADQPLIVDPGGYLDVVASNGVWNASTTTGHLYTGGVSLSASAGTTGTEITNNSIDSIEFSAGGIQLASIVAGSQPGVIMFIQDKAYTAATGAPVPLSTPAAIVTTPLANDQVNLPATLPAGPGVYNFTKVHNVGPGFLDIKDSTDAIVVKTLPAGETYEAYNR